MEITENCRVDKDIWVHFNLIQLKILEFEKVEWLIQIRIFLIDNISMEKRGDYAQPKGLLWENEIRILEVIIRYIYWNKS